MISEGVGYEGSLMELAEPIVGQEWNELQGNRLNCLDRHLPTRGGQLCSVQYPRCRFREGSLVFLGQARLVGVTTNVCLSNSTG